MSHANAALTPRARLRLAQLVVERKWTYAAAAKMFMVAPRTAKKWADRYRAEGPVGMSDRTSRPHTSSTPTSADLVRQIVGLRWRHRLGPVQIAGRLGMPASTMHAVLLRSRVNRLSHVDRVTVASSATPVEPRSVMTLTWAHAGVSSVARPSG